MDKEQALRILGLTAVPTATELKRVYREQVRLWHPDRYSQRSALRPIAERNIQDANLAYAVLRRLAAERRRASSPRPAPQRPSSPARGPAPQALKMTLHLQMLKRLRRMIPRMDLGPLWKWLQRDRRPAFRAWYQYPGKDASAGRKTTDISFEQALRKALRPSTGMRPLPRQHARLPVEETPEAVTAITQVRRSDRSKPC
jgi:curved DNA-binding protein CbpA